jgi:hypothetical protein
VSEQTTKSCWGVFSRTGQRTHFRVCVATEAQALAELETIKGEEEGSQDEYWVAELEAEAAEWARSMKIYKSAREMAR